MTSTSRTARCGPACRVVWQGRDPLGSPPMPMVRATNVVGNTTRSIPPRLHSSISVLEPSSARGPDPRVVSRRFRHCVFCAGRVNSSLTQSCSARRSTARLRVRAPARPPRRMGRVSFCHWENKSERSLRPSDFAATTSPNITGGHKKTHGQRGLNGRKRHDARRDASLLCVTSYRSKC